MIDAITKEDWIIIRLLRSRMRAGEINSADVIDVHQSVYYLFKKYGWEVMDAAADVLDAEGKK